MTIPFLVSIKDKPTKEMVRIIKIFPQFLRGLADVGRFPDFPYYSTHIEKIYKLKNPTAARCYKRSA